MSTSLRAQNGGEVVCTEACGARGAAVAPELVDPADDGRALVACQPLAHWNGQPLVLPLAPWFLRRVLKTKVPGAGCLLAMEEGRARADVTGKPLGDLLQANSLVWERACGVAARGHRGRWRRTLVEDFVGHQCENLREI